MISDRLLTIDAVCRVKRNCYKLESQGVGNKPLRTNYHKQHFEADWFGSSDSTDTLHHHLLDFGHEVESSALSQSTICCTLKPNSSDILARQTPYATVCLTDGNFGSILNDRDDTKWNRLQDKYFSCWIVLGDKNTSSCINKCYIIINHPRPHHFLFVFTISISGFMLSYIESI